MKFPSPVICFLIAFEFLSVFFVLFPICVVFLLYCRMIFLSLRRSHYAEKSFFFFLRIFPCIRQCLLVYIINKLWVNSPWGRLINLISCSEGIFFFAHFPIISIFLLCIFLILFFKFQWLSVLVIYYCYYK